MPLPSLSSRFPTFPVQSLSVSGFEAGLGAQLHLRTAWDTCVQAIEGLELHSVIDRGGFATVFKG